VYLFNNGIVSFEENLFENSTCLGRFGSAAHFGTWDVRFQNGTHRKSIDNP
jgi:hypothetical protein